jgi:erythromycin esterase
MSLSRRYFLSGAAAFAVTGTGLASATTEPLTGFDPTPLLNGMTPAQDAAGSIARDPASRTAWLSANAAPLRSIDLADNDFTDLEPLRAAIRDARIVLLGEQTHGDGTTFLAKSRLIRFLHERMGFDVLAFESGFYDMPQAWKRIRAGASARSAVRHGLYGIWARSREVQPLIDYIGERARGTRPLELTAFDCKFTNLGSARFAEDLVAVLAANGIDTGTMAPWPRFRGVIESLADGSKFAEWKPSAEENHIVQTVADKLIKRLAITRAADAAYWRQLLKSAKALSEMRLHMVDANNVSFGDVLRRDAAMGDNHVWLAREAHPQRKIIVWAATFHNIRNMRLMSPDMKDVRLMGDFVWEALGEKTYNIGFTTHEGARGWVGAKETPIDPPLADSLEGLWGATAQRNAFLDLRNPPAGGEWLDEPMVSYLLNGSATTLYWRKLFDAAMFLRTMRGSTMAG